MADGTKRTGGEPVFDTERAWARFEKLAGEEPAPAFWRRMAEDVQDKQHIHEKDGAVEMKRTGDFRETQGAPVVGPAAVVGSAARGNGADGGTWRTERPGKRRLRRWTAGVAAAVIVVGLFTTSLGDRALASMLQTFRIQHIVGVGITADDLTSISDILDHGSPEGDHRFDLAQYGTLNQSGGGQTRTVTWEEANQRMGSSLLQPDNATAPSFQPATTLTFNLNVKAVNRLLTRLGSSSELPAAADGKAIRMYIPDGVTTTGSLAGKPVRLLQFGKPELTVEEGIDVAAVRNAVLGLPVLPDSLRTKLSAIGDWQSTLPVPAPEGVTTSVRLAGHEALMTVNGKHRYLFWVDGERMSLLAGDIQDFPAEADFQRAAEELVGP